jgi:hypothetical protein
MKTRFIAGLCLMALFAVMVHAQDGDFQTGQIVSFERAAANAQHMENEDYYKVSMRLNGVIYKCRASGPASTFIDWSINKEFPAKLASEKTLLVKSPNGQIVEMTVLGKKVPK